MKSLYTRSIQLVSIFVLSVGLVACGGDRSASERSAPDAPASESQKVAEANQSSAAVNVVAKDFEFALDANEAEAGTITFNITNEGSMPHDFAITIDGERHKTKMIQPGESAALTVDLQSGTYDYICTVPGHDILGMKGTFTVN
jgi:uncharacterized cupredoxin-like copper-binding protein